MEQVPVSEYDDYDEHPEVKPDEPGYADGLLDANEEPGEAGPAPWNDYMRMERLIDQIRAHYEAKARPLLAQQRRNGGVRIPALAQLDLECEREIDTVVRTYQQAGAYARAARDQASGRAHMRAVERQRSRQNLGSFAQDLGRGRRYEAPEPAGRSVRDTWIW
jgi:hypothetical protein